MVLRRPLDIIGSPRLRAQSTPAQRSIKTAAKVAMSPQPTIAAKLVSSLISISIFFSKDKRKTAHDRKTVGGKPLTTIKNKSQSKNNRPPVEVVAGSRFERLSFGV